MPEKFNVDLCHEHILMTRKPLLAFDENADYNLWKDNVRVRLDELMGDLPQMTAPDLCIEWEEDRGEFTERRFVFTAEYETRVPCHLLIPKNAKKPLPLMICVQGHSTGMHISLGRTIYEGDDKRVSGGDRDFALQSVKRGYAALVIENRAMGERKSEHIDALVTCEHPSMVALLLGRTMIRERIWDISRAIDVVEGFEEIDCDKIAVMGNSGGGTVSYYAACIEPRIKAAMPSCAVCSFDRSIGIMRHCGCNYIPSMAKYFDMGDIACLIAPKPLVIVAGAKDPFFLIDGVQKTYNVIESIYRKQGSEGKCRLVVGDEGHRFYADAAWKAFEEISEF